MGTVDRRADRGDRRAVRLLRQFGDEVREARIAAGLSQATLGEATGLSQPQLSRLERAQLAHLSIRRASIVAAVLGLDLSVRTYPAGTGLRDAGQAARLQRFLQHVGEPLRYRTEVGLPQRPDSGMELRSWDAMIWGGGERTAVEFEMRVTDAQAMTRRHQLKRRDDSPDSFLLALADTRTNRRIHAQCADLWPDLPKLRTSHVLSLLEAGQHPPSGIVFL